MASTFTTMFSDDDLATFREAFDVFDSDHNGFISQSEVTSTFEKLGLDPSQARIDIIFSKHDSDGDGFLDFDEFLKIMEHAANLDEQ